MPFLVLCQENMHCATTFQSVFLCFRKLALLVSTSSAKNADIVTNLPSVCTSMLFKICPFWYSAKKIYIVPTLQSGLVCCVKLVLSGTLLIKGLSALVWCIIVQELCESRGGRPGLSVLTSLLVSVDVKIYCTVLRHWSQLVPNMSHDI